MKRKIITKSHDVGFRKNEAYEGETIENKVRRMTTTKEQITDSAPVYFTARKDGVRPEFDIRTDKWAVALDAMQKVNSQELTKFAQGKQAEQPKGEGDNTPQAES